MILECLIKNDSSKSKQQCDDCEDHCHRKDLFRWKKSVDTDALLLIWIQSQQFETFPVLFEYGLSANPKCGYGSKKFHIFWVYNIPFGDVMRRKIIATGKLAKKATANLIIDRVKPVLLTKFISHCWGGINSGNFQIEDDIMRTNPFLIISSCRTFFHNKSKRFYYYWWMTEISLFLSYYFGFTLPSCQEESSSTANRISRASSQSQTSLYHMQIYSLYYTTLR